MDSNQTRPAGLFPDRAGKGIRFIKLQSRFPGKLPKGKLPCPFLHLFLWTGQLEIHAFVYCLDRRSFPERPPLNEIYRFKISLAITTRWISDVPSYRVVPMMSLR